MDVPETKYAKTVDDVHIAYQVLGTGPIDIVLLGWMVNIEASWRWPKPASFFRRLATFSRLIMLDRRGSGSSDRVLEKQRALSLDVRMDDIRAVMDAVGSERAVVVGLEEGFAVAALFAATYPDRTTGLIAYGASARTAWAPDYPWGISPEENAADVADVEAGWGTTELTRTWVPYVFHDDAEDAQLPDLFASWMRGGAGPGDAVSLLEVDWETDIRQVLPTIRVPTVVIHRSGDRAVSIEHGRYLAEHIPGARLVELPGASHGWPASDDLDQAIEEFVIALRREEAEFDRLLATVLFTDIVGSTE